LGLTKRSIIQFSELVEKNKNKNLITDEQSLTCQL